MIKCLCDLREDSNSPVRFFESKEEKGNTRSKLAINVVIEEINDFFVIVIIYVKVFKCVFLFFSP